MVKQTKNNNKQQQVKSTGDTKNGDAHNNKEAKTSGYKTGVPAENPLHKTVRICYLQGKIQCNNPEHFRYGKANDEDKYCTALPLKPIAIIKQMEYNTPAKCKCERDACESMWGSSTIGTFQNAYVCDGNRYVGFGKLENLRSPKRVCPLPYSLTPKQLEVLHKRYPDWLFDTTTGGHDHPIAHTTSMVDTYEIMHKTSAHHKNILDLHGSPRANAKIMQGRKDGLKIFTVVSKETGKDYLRAATKWAGAEYIESSLRDVTTCDQLLTGNAGDEDRTFIPDHVVSFHTLYYYDMSEVAKLLSVKPGMTMTATMHRFDKQKGYINGGEQHYEKITKSGQPTNITQTNVDTTVRYNHKDNSAWFDHTSWTPTHDNLEAAADNTTLNSLVWDINKSSEDTYVFTITAVPPKAVYLDLDHTIVDELKKKKKETKQEKAMVTILDEVVYLPVHDDHAELHDYLVKYVAGKPRDAKVYSTVQTAARNKSNSMMSDRKLDISSDELRAVVTSAFWYEHEADFGVATNFDSLGKEFARQQLAWITGCNYFKSKRVVKDVLGVVKAALRCKTKQDFALACVDQLDKIFDRETI
jgi:hypothetical protein